MYIPIQMQLNKPEVNLQIVVMLVILEEHYIIYIKVSKKLYYIHDVSRKNANILSFEFKTPHGALDLRQSTQANKLFFKMNSDLY